MMSSRFRGLCSFALYVGVAAHNLYAQEKRCDNLRPLPASASGYQQRGNRCEGLYVVDVGRQSIDVISFTRGQLAFDLRPGRVLRVSALSRLPLVRIRAVAIPLRTYYRMDATLDNGSVLTWPVTAVLLPETLDASRIGVFGWTGREGSKTFVPVQVTAEGSATASVSSDHLFLAVQPSFDADRIKWRWAPAKENGCSVYPPWQDAIHSPVTAGWPVRIDVSGLPTGVHCVEVFGSSQTGNPGVPIRIRIAIP